MMLFFDEAGAEWEKSNKEGSLHCPSLLLGLLASFSGLCIHEAVSSFGKPRLCEKWLEMRILSGEVQFACLQPGTERERPLVWQDCRCRRLHRGFNMSLQSFTVFQHALFLSL